jgi:hypothetical protein
VLLPLLFFFSPSVVSLSFFFCDVNVDEDFLGLFPIREKRRGVEGNFS